MKNNLVDLLVSLAKLPLGIKSVRLPGRHTVLREFLVENCQLFSIFGSLMPVQVAVMSTRRWCEILLKRGKGEAFGSVEKSVEGGNA